jgi:hypothetical protein
VKPDERIAWQNDGCHRSQVYQKEAYRLTPDQIASPVRSPTLATA